ncbi:phage tail protein [Desertimonas flava]|uniref:phage tail protein n=1 Tax=Desertimonas flava TaxID=2064846 RepID=UPI000E3438C6|nr:tail fiber protein [Desertimonas flava]
MDPILGSIMLFGFDWAPKGWMRCDGTIISIAQNQALFSLLGTTYGGDGVTNFALPDLRGRAPIHDSGPTSSGYEIGQQGGSASVTLTASNLPAHTHTVAPVASATASSKSPSGNAPAFTDAGASYGTPDGTVMAAATSSSTGNSTPVATMPPYLAMNYCICIAGIYPSRQ